MKLLILTALAVAFLSFAVTPAPAATHRCTFRTINSAVFLTVHGRQVSAQACRTTQRRWQQSGVTFRPVSRASGRLIGTWQLRGFDWFVTVHATRAFRETSALIHALMKRDKTWRRVR